MPSPIIDLTGQTFGFLTVVRITNKRNSTNKLLWECVCTCTRNTCAKVIFVPYQPLILGLTTSCQWHQHDRAIHPAIRLYFSQVRSRAAHRKYTFELTLRQFINAVKLPCHYCNSNNDIKLIHNRTKRWALRANGIDRWDNCLGYTVENSVPCCWLCNQLKRAMTAQEYIDHCKNVAKHNE